VVKVDQLFGRLVGQGFSEFVKALGPADDLEDEGADVLVAPDVALFVLHLVVVGVFYEFKAVLDVDLGGL
jgi:hypothetical protein